MSTVKKERCRCGTSKKWRKRKRSGKWLGMLGCKDRREEGKGGEDLFCYFPSKLPKHLTAEPVLWRHASDQGPLKLLLKRAGSQARGKCLSNCGWGAVRRTGVESSSRSWTSAFRFWWSCAPKSEPLRKGIASKSRQTRKANTDRGSYRNCLFHLWAPRKPCPCFLEDLWSKTVWRRGNREWERRGNKSHGWCLRIRD